MKKNLTDTFINDLYKLAIKEIPDTVLLQAKKCIIDYLGVCIAGAVIAKDKCQTYLNYFDSDQHEATVIGHGTKAALHNAAFVNGYSGHIAELDDGHRFSMVHLGATIIPAILAVAEHEGLNGNDLLRGIVIGYEAAIRLGMAIQPSHKHKGFHVSGTCGTIGASMGISAALKFSETQMKNALSASIASAAGVLEVIEDDSELKPYNICRAAHDGITAAYAGRAGFKGPNDIIGGKRGFFALMSSEHDKDKLLGEKDYSYGIEKIYRKPYAACRHCHAPIEAVFNLKKKHGLKSSEIKQIKVRTYSLAVFGHEHTDVSGITSAKMSTPYCVAVALETGRAGLSEFLPEYFNNSTIMSLAEKVTTSEDKELSALVPGKRAAIVEIVTMNDNKYVERVDYPKGEPENPMTREDIEEKFVSMTDYAGKSRYDSNRIIQLIWNIEKKLPELFEML